VYDTNMQWGGIKKKKRNSTARLMGFGVGDKGETKPRTLNGIRVFCKGKSERGKKSGKKQKKTIKVRDIRGSQKEKGPRI